jgi:hypothetical protein
VVQRAIKPQIYENLLRHLTEVEENRSQWVHDHFPQLSPEREQVVNLLDLYVKQLDDFLCSCIRSDRAGNELPFVTMGCQVEVVNSSNGKKQVLEILPLYEERAKSNHISILSPMGSALLLKNKGATVTIKAPRGDIDWQVLSIQYPENN